MKLYTEWQQFSAAAGDYVNRQARPVVSHVCYDASGVVTLATQGVTVALLPSDIIELAAWLTHLRAEGTTVH